MKEFISTEKLLLQASMQEFALMLGKVLEEYLTKEGKTAATLEPQNRILTRKEAAEFLKITLPTLHAWTQRGLLHPHKVDNSSRVYYLESEVRELIASSKKSTHYAY